jgi:putative two-component system response regulator
LEIPLGARIIAVADVYDALTSDRPYRKAMPPFEARDYIVKQSGTDFDPVVVDTFTQTFNQGLLEVPELLV